MTCDAVAVLDELRARYLREPGGHAWAPSLADVMRWTGSTTGAEPGFYDSVGAELAHRYQRGQASFDFCDGVANGLFGALAQAQSSAADFGWPDLFHEVFLAFDAGEFHHVGDKSDDPIRDQTNPAIAAIVQKLGSVL